MQGHVTNNQASHLKYPSGQLIEDRSYSSFCTGSLLLVSIPYLSTVQSIRKTDKSISEYLKQLLLWTHAEASQKCKPVVRYMKS